MRARSDAHMTKARTVLVRGVGSALRAAQRQPLVIDRSSGSRLVDVDGNSYVDYVLAFGPVLLGHRPPAVVDRVANELARGVLYGAQHAGELELAERLTRLVPGAEMVALSTTGSEAVHAAIRIARAATGRRLILKFEGHYHGWIDPVYVNGPGSPPLQGPPPHKPTHSVPGLAASDEVLVARWNEIEELRAVLGLHQGDVAAVVMEPVACNFGNFEPRPGYLAAVRELCDRVGALLIFDEVITGFRIGLGGAQERYGVIPDLTVLAKAIASGFPVSAVAGRRSVMEVASRGPVRHAGTYNGHPVSVSAALATLDQLEENAGAVYRVLESRSAQLADGLREAADAVGAPLVVNRVGSVMQILWTENNPVTSYEQAYRADAGAVGDLAAHMLDDGVHALERGLWFVSAAHTEEDIATTIEAARNAMVAVQEERSRGRIAKLS